MKALFGAYASAWSQSGAAHLAALIHSLDIPAHIASPDHKMPAVLRPHYEQAIAGLTDFRKLRQQLSLQGARLPWMQGSMRMPEGFQGRFAYVELAGPRGIVANADISFGLYLQQRGTVYPSHWHCAEEDYLVLSGTALWQTDDDGFVARPPGAHIRHASTQRHATTTLDDPLLAMWFWQGDIRDSTYRIVGIDA